VARRPHGPHAAVAAGARARPRGAHRTRHPRCHGRRLAARAQRQPGPGAGGVGRAAPGGARSRLRAARRRGGGRHRCHRAGAVDTARPSAVGHRRGGRPAGAARRDGIRALDRGAHRAPGTADAWRRAGGGPRAGTASTALGRGRSRRHRAGGLVGLRCRLGAHR
jgi:hypothetical protein